MLESELHDLSDDSDYAASQQQGSASVMVSSDRTKQGSSSELDCAEIVFLKDNVAIHPTQFASERISGRLKLIKQSSSLFMNWIPYKAHSSDSRLSDKDRNLYTIRAVPFTDIRSVRRHTPALGWQYIIVVLSSGLAYPPLYFYSGGVKEFLATIKQHVLLVRSAEDANVFLVNDFQNTLQRTLSSLELPRAVTIAFGPSNLSGDNESAMNENQERADGGVNSVSVNAAQFHGRPRHKVHDPTRDLSIQVLEKFSLVTKFARETTSQLFRENQSNGFSPSERRTHIQTNLDHPKKPSNVAGNVPDESPVVADPLEFDKVSLVWGKPRQPPLGSEEVNNTDAEGRLTLADALVYACNQGVEKIVDLATLTGACVVALGPSIAGVFTPNDDLAKEIFDASEASGEKLWRLPIEDSYWESMKSGVADMVNTGGRQGGAITAALFLKQFVDEKVQWMHIDLAGPVWNDKKRSATGFGVATLVEWVLRNSS